MIRFKLSQGAIERVDKAQSRFASAGEQPELLDCKDRYLRRVLARETVFIRDLKKFSSQLRAKLAPIISRAFGEVNVMVELSGAIMKHTAIAHGGHCDLLLSMPNETDDLSVKFDHLLQELERAGLSPVVKGCVISCRVLGHNVDLIPAIRVPDWSDRFRLQLVDGTRTNPWRQNSHLRSADQADVMRLVKVWRDQHRLHFPGFLLDVVVAKSLAGFEGPASLYRRLRKVFRFLADSFVLAKIHDPGDWRNDLNSELTFKEQRAIQGVARAALECTTAQEIIRLKSRKRLRMAIGSAKSRQGLRKGSCLA